MKIDETDIVIILFFLNFHIDNLAKTHIKNVIKLNHAIKRSAYRCVKKNTPIKLKKSKNKRQNHKKKSVSSSFVSKFILKNEVITNKIINN